MVATVSFSQFVALLFSDPNFGLGIYILLILYTSLFLFCEWFYLSLLLPNALFCFSLTKHVTPHLEEKGK